MKNNEIFAVLVKESQYIEGDERSRTNPGHGYPAYTLEYTNLIKFKSKEELVAWCDRNDQEEFEAIVYRPLKVKHTLSVEIE